MFLSIQDFDDILKYLVFIFISLVIRAQTLVDKNDKYFP